MEAPSKFLSKLSFFRFLGVFLIFSFTSVNVFAQKTGKIAISGSFWDDNTGIDLKTIIYGLKSNEKIKLSETDSKNLFSFELETDIETLVFESDGYSKVIVPLNYVGDFINPSSANLSINSKGGFAQYQLKDLIIFCLPFTHQKGFKYELMTIKNDSLYITSNFSISIENKHSSALPFPQNNFQNNLKVVISNGFNQIIQETDFKAKEGITLVDINIYPNKKEDEISLNDSKNENETAYNQLKLLQIQDANLPYPNLGIRNIYFDQSKFELKSENKFILDSIAIYLNQKMNTKINVVGHTDNIGNETLNLTLAKYRAQVVANYLKNKGVNSEQMFIKWKNKNIYMKKETEDLNKFRKVYIEEIK
jgi:outer membrane protein OmpA-like peptidoglycan-associated protein